MRLVTKCKTKMATFLCRISNADKKGHEILCFLQRKKLNTLTVEIIITGQNLDVKEHKAKIFEKWNEFS